MLNTIKFLIICIIGFLFPLCFTQCKSAKQVSQLEVKKIASADFEKAQNSTANFNVETISIKKDEIIFTVTYTHACKNDVFELLWDGTYAKSIPPQVTVFLKRNATGNNCKATQKKELRFSIKGIRQASQHEIVINYAKTSFSYHY